MLAVTGLVPALGATLAAPVAAASFSQIYAFGDSLVDTGNAFALTTSILGTGIPPEPYFEGHFSNGPVLPEYLAADLGIPETSLGFGGATSGEQGLLLFGGGPILPVPGLLSQVDQFVATSTGVDPDALYVLWAGAVDYLFAGVTNPVGPVGNITGAIDSLSNAGAQHFLVGNLPDLGNLPLPQLLGLPPDAIAGLNLVSDAHNGLLADTLSTLNTSTDLSIELLDANALLRSALAGEQGFSNVSDPCTLTPSCVSDPTVQASFLFWDEVHPTTQAHRIVADVALAQLQDDPVATPEPTAMVGLTVLGLLAIGGLQRWPH